ncbi:DoxX family protein [Flavobacterium restrictum]|uniref:DoxX family protein n=1 Tax=Flavobacterium restrictum TaxID=2594428 RepID=A0A553E2M0_9FLAO|nr:DoxX family protein [Flavobacterium restrictum]TRX39289.1 DoxX family protein [Flavobacterium restrictum]
MNLPWHLYIMAFVYFTAGVNHFRAPKVYLKIIPSYFPNPKFINSASGFVEIILSLLLLYPQVTNRAAWGIIALLIAVFPVHLNMLFHSKASLNLPIWILIARVPLQLILIFWAYQYTFSNY